MSPSPYRGSRHSANEYRTELFTPLSIGKPWSFSGEIEQVSEDRKWCGTRGKGSWVSLKDGALDEV